MDVKISVYLENIIKNSTAVSEDAIRELQEQTEFELPPDYVSLMREFNGGEGEVGKNSWLCLFPLEKLIEINKDYEFLMQQIPDYFLFGKDAADTGYAFHKSEQTVHSFGLMSNFKTDPIEFCGNSFSNFIKYLYAQ